MFYTEAREGLDIELLIAVIGIKDGHYNPNEIGDNELDNSTDWDIIIRKDTGEKVV